MDVNGITSVSTNSVKTYTSSSSSAKTTSTKSSSYGTDAAAVYEKSDEAKKASSNSALIKKLKADTESRLSQMQNLVKEMMLKQGQTYTNADSMWKFLASGDYTVDAQTAKDAKDAISEDGYWGVNQTSQRIFDFAVSLSGGDSEKMDKMLEAFKKGFSQATKAWGKNLPDISSQTYDAVIKKFDDYKNSKTDTE